jgi:hypothetical protein
LRRADPGSQGAGSWEKITMNWNSLHPVEIAGLLRELAVKLLDAPDLGRALDDAAATVHETLGVPCGLSVWGVSHRAELAARPSGLVALSRAELRAGDGPGLAAIRLRETITTDDLWVERRWPEWRRTALRHGLRSALVTPIDVGSDGVALLSLYATTADGIDPAAEATARLLAEHTGLLLMHLLSRRRNADLPVMHRASGIIMARWGCPEDDARAILAATSAALAIPLTELVERLVTATHH